MGSGVPLLNEYKQEFLWKRLPQTILGGPKLKLGYDAPFYIYVNQILLFQIPWVIGGICTALVEFHAIPFDTGIYITGSVVCVFVLIVNLLSAYKRRSQAAVSPVTQNAQNILAEEDEIDFTSCCAIESVTFVAPGKKYTINIILHSLLSGVLCGLGFWYVLPTTLSGLYSSMAATVILYFLGWFTLCVAQYSLTMGGPPESATFKTDDMYEITPLMRPFYCGVCFSIDLLARYSGVDLILTNQIIHVVFVLLPLLWMVGILAPLDALLPWVFEQALVILFGGSPMASSIRLLLMLLGSVSIYLAVYYIPHGLATCVLMASFGYLLSTDLGALGSLLLKVCRSSRPQPNQAFPEENPGFLWKWTPREFAFHFVMMVLAGGLAGVLNCFLAPSVGTIPDYLAYAVMALFIVEVILSEVQSVYVFFGLWRNRLYPSSIQRTTIFQQGKARLNIVGYFRRFIINGVGPLLMLVYLSLSMTYTTSSASFSFSSNSSDNSSIQISSSYSTAASILGANRAFRWIWQNTHSAMLEIGILQVMNLALPITFSLPWRSLGTGMQLLILSLLRDRLSELLHKLYFFFALLISSWTDKKQRRKSTVITIILNVLLFPLVFCIIAIATALSAPLLSLFTLPLFFVGFPRPWQSWPGSVGASANTCPDTVYYRQVALKLALALRVAYANGSMGEPSVGAHYLVRYQDRLIWVQVLERGYLYTSISIKGLELQETSCHTVEAARIDDIFSMSFEREKGFSCCEWNIHPLNVLRPYDAAILRTYSDARNQLTGVIDSPDSLKLITSSFVQALVWLMLHHCYNKKQQGDISCPPKLSTDGKAHFGAHRRPGSGKSWEKLDEENAKDSTAEGATLRKSGSLLSSLGGELVDDVPWDEKEKQYKSQRPISGKSRPRSGHHRRNSLKSTSDSWGSDNESLILEPLESILKPNLVSGLSSRGMGASAIVRDEIESGTVLPPLKEDQTLRNQTFRARIPGFISDAVDNDILNDLDLGMPAMDIEQKKALDAHIFTATSIAKTDPHTTAQVNLTNLGESLHFVSLSSRLVSPPLHWREVPIDWRWIEPLLDKFPKAWYHHVISIMKFGAQSGTTNVSAEISRDSALEDLYRRLVMACYAVVNVMGYGVLDTASLGPSHVHKVYSGDIPWSAAASWIQDDPELQPLVLKAYRYGVKLAIDQTVLGEVSSLEELQEYMEEYDRDCYIGLETDAAWADAILQSKPNLFSLSYNPTQGSFSSRVLTCQDMVVAMGSVSKEAVRGQWANLALELLYMTNDDEERNSIQAHATMLRNLTVQAADPPLGYPIYASQPLSIPTL